MLNSSQYIPGVCNIGTEERILRRRSGYVSLLASFIIILIISITKADHIFKFVLFFPVFGTLISFIQDRLHFCAAFGLQGLYNFSKVILKSNRIQENNYLIEDRKKAIKIIIYSLLLSILITAVLYLFL